MSPIYLFWNNMHIRNAFDTYSGKTDTTRPTKAIVAVFHRTGVTLGPVSTLRITPVTVYLKRNSVPTSRSCNGRTGSRSSRCGGQPKISQPQLFINHRNLNHVRNLVHGLLGQAAQGPSCPGLRVQRHPNGGTLHLFDLGPPSLDPYPVFLATFSAS